MQIDTSTEFGKRVEQRLNEELIGWLTTVGDDGTPQPSPIWFLWEHGSLLIYSQPNTPKLRHIAARPSVSLSLDSKPEAGGIAILTGNARVDEAAPPANEHAAYVKKYDARIARLGYTPEQFAATYSVPIRVTPAKLRGH